MDRRRNLEKSEKLLTFALEQGLGVKNSVKIDLDVDGDSNFIETIMVFIQISLDGDGSYELSDITFELARQKRIIQQILDHPKLQFKHDASLSGTPEQENFVSDIEILKLNIDPEYFIVGWHAMIQPIMD